MEWTVAAYAAGDAVEWERLVAGSGQSTFLHTRAFLAYHGDRFVDRSLTIRDAAGRLCGVFPAAESPHDPAVVVSHPGATFGGLLTAGAVTGSRYRVMFECALRHWRDGGVRTLVYNAVPFVYHRTPFQEDTYVLWRLGARLSRRTLSACIDLADRQPPSSRRRRSLQKAQRSACEVRRGTAILPQLWEVVTAALMERHHVRPVHTLDEIEYLATRFVPEVECLGAFDGEKILGGVVLFHSPRVTHVQYSVSSQAGMKVGAMDLLVERGIADAVERNARFFDLGISTDPSGAELNDTLHQFKTEFGAGAIVYDQYELDLSAAAT